MLLFLQDFFLCICPARIICPAFWPSWADNFTLNSTNHIPRYACFQMKTFKTTELVGIKYQLWVWFDEWLIGLYQKIDFSLVWFYQNQWIWKNYDSLQKNMYKCSFWKFDLVIIKFIENYPKFSTQSKYLFGLNTEIIRKYINISWIRKFIKDLLK